MKKIAILSGKGGVGKSSIAASLACSFSKDMKIVCADCDVDASNLSLLFGLDTDKYNEWKPISTNQIAKIDRDRCISCGKCVETCYFNALELKNSLPHVKGMGCEGCGACSLVCPENAISLVDIDNAFIGYSMTKQGFPISSAQLLPGSSGSGKVVAEVKKKAESIAEDADIMIIDSAAGIGCPVIASVTGSDYALLVTEPTPSGFEDMLRALHMIDHFKIKKGIIINKYDLNSEYSKKIEDFAEKNSISIIAKLKFDKIFIEAMTNMVPLVRYCRSYSDIFDDIKKKLGKELEVIKR